MTDANKTYSTKSLSDFAKKLWRLLSELTFHRRDKITFVKAMNSFNWALLEIIVKFFTACFTASAGGWTVLLHWPPSPP